MAEAESRDRSVPDHIYRHPVLRHFWARMHVQNKNLLVAIVGETGSGKSYAGLSLGETLDRKFGFDETAFKPTEFIELVQDKSYPQGSIILADESGVSMSHREWWSEANKRIGEVIQTWRHQNRGAIFTLPSLDLLDKVVRERLHYIIKMEHIDWRNDRSRGRVKINQKNPELGGVYRKKPRIEEGGRIKEYPNMYFALPSADLRERYEAAKDGYTDKINQEAYEEIKEAGEDEDSGPETPKEVAHHIIGEEIIDDYIGENNGQYYIDKDLIAADFGLGRNRAKQAKKLLERSEEGQLRIAEREQT